MLPPTTTTTTTVFPYRDGGTRRVLAIGLHEVSPPHRSNLSKLNYFYTDVRARTNERIIITAVYIHICRTKIVFPLSTRPYFFLLLHLFLVTFSRHPHKTQPWTPASKSNPYAFAPITCRSARVYAVINQPSGRMSAANAHADPCPPSCPPSKRLYTHTHCLLRLDRNPHGFPPTSCLFIIFFYHRIAIDEWVSARFVINPKQKKKKTLLNNRRCESLPNCVRSRARHIHEQGRR